MAEEPKVIMLNGGTDVHVALVAGADAFLLQLLGGAPSKTGAATLKVVKNASGVPFVAVLIAGKHAGFLSHTDAQDLVPILGAFEQQGAVAEAKAVLTLGPDGAAVPTLKLSLASPDQLLSMPTAVPSPPAVASREGQPATDHHCRGCGKSLPAEAKFCLECGTPVAVTTAPAQGSAAPAQPVLPAHSTVTSAPVSTSTMSAFPGPVPRPSQFSKTPSKSRVWWNRQSSRNKKLFITGAVVVLLIIVASAVSGGGGNGAEDVAGVTTSAVTAAITSATTATSATATPTTHAATPPSTQAPASSTTEPSTTTTQGFPTYSDGMYEVGTDIPAGLYRSVELESIAYWQISKDASGELGSIIANDNVSGPCYIELTKGQYLTLNGLTIAPADAVRPAKILSANISDGVYLAGTDIAAGRYKGTVTGDYGYWQVSTDANGSLSHIVANGNVEGQFYVEVAKGQYLKLVRVTVSIVK